MNAWKLFLVTIFLFSSNNVYLLLSDFYILCLFISCLCGSVMKKRITTVQQLHAAAHSWLSSDSADSHLDRWGRTINKERRIAQKVKDFSFYLWYRNLQSLAVSRHITHQPFRHCPETKQHQDNWLACQYMFIAFKVSRARNNRHR